jgi:hypothetical protein
MEAVSRGCLGRRRNRPCYIQQMRAHSCVFPSEMLYLHALGHLSCAMRNIPKGVDEQAQAVSKAAAPQIQHKPPPRKFVMIEQTNVTAEPAVQWTSVERSAWAQQGRDVDVYVRLSTCPLLSCSIVSLYRFYSKRFALCFPAA